MHSISTVVLAAIPSVCLSVLASPLTPTPTRKDLFPDHDAPSAVKRQALQPTFPPSPPSCPICAQNYPSINNCAQAAPAFANFSQIIFNPGEFIGLIKCACTDTFQAAYPQCVDCFEQTNQTAAFGASSDSLPSTVSGMRSVCAVGATLLGNVTGADGEQVKGAPSAVPSNDAIRTRSAPGMVLLLNLAMAMTLSCLGFMVLDHEIFMP